MTEDRPTLYKCNDCHLIFEGHEKAVKHTDKFMSHTIGKVEKIKEGE